MPKKFNECVAGGGRVRTVNPKAGHHMKVCFPKGGGSSVAGHVQKNKPARKPRRRRRS